MADWQAGDLALCVKGGRLRGNITKGPFPRAGHCYEVASIAGQRWSYGPDGYVPKPALQLPEAPPNAMGDHFWAAHRFIKVTPPEADEFDRETIALETRTPITAEGVEP